MNSAEPDGDARAATAGVGIPPRRISEDALIGAGSPAAKLFCHPGVLIGGPRALLMQVAAPGVAAGVVEHSRYAEDPFSRLLGTLAVVATVAFADAPARETAVDLLAARHRPVVGTTPSGDPYSAADPALSTWVYATLVDSALAADRRWLGLLDKDQERRFYGDAQRLGCALGVPPGALPDTLERFAEWMASETAALEVGPQALSVAEGISKLPFRRTWGPPGILLEAIGEPATALLTADLLPDSIRDAYGMRRPTRAEAALISSVAAASKVVARRTAGKPHPDGPTLLASRITRTRLKRRP